MEANDEMVAGYRLGTRGTPLPDGASLSFEHGWRNGMIDTGQLPSSRLTLAQIGSAADECMAVDAADLAARRRASEDGEGKP